MNPLLSFTRHLLTILLIGLVPHGVAQTLLADGQHPRQIEATQFASAWVELYDAGRDEVTHALLTESFRAANPLETWRKEVKAHNRQLGRPLARQLLAMRWREQAGTHVFVEFEGRFENADPHWRQVHLYAVEGGPFLVQGHSQRYTPSKPVTPHKDNAQ